MKKTCKFWLGTHMPVHMTRTGVPLCVSYGRLRRRRRLPDPLGEIFLDSRGFSEIAQHGRYTFKPSEYAEFVERAAAQWGPKLCHASVMDWMCEPWMLAKTGMTVARHQQLTVNSWIALNGINNELPWLPVLQGYTPDEYLACAELYRRHAGVDLRKLPLVGLGSVCRRQAMTDAAEIVTGLVAAGFRNLHAFGFKINGLLGKNSLCLLLKSADSMAWSFDGRRHDGVSANSLEYALGWRRRVVKGIRSATSLYNVRRGGVRK